MTAPTSAQTLASLDPGPALTRRARLEAAASAEDTARSDRELQFDAIVWRLRRSAAAALPDPASLVATMLECAQALEQLQALYRPREHVMALCLRTPQSGPGGDGGGGGGADVDAGAVADGSTWRSI
jgi:hypothetical protein